jgi:hypothetical protein
MIVCPVRQQPALDTPVAAGFGVVTLFGDAFRMDDAKRAAGLSWYDDAQLPAGAVAIHQPDRFDVLLGRGRGHVSNPGNKRLQIAVNMHKDRYNSPATSRAEKTKITTDIVHFIKACAGESGRFLKYHGIMGCWFEVEDEVARLKVSQALRYTRRATHAFSSSVASGSGGDDQESVTSRSSQADAESVVPAKVASSPSSSGPSAIGDSHKKKDAVTRGSSSTSKDLRPSDHSGALLIDYDNGSALDPIGPDFEW